MTESQNLTPRLHPKVSGAWLWFFCLSGALLLGLGIGIGIGLSLGSGDQVAQPETKTETKTIPTKKYQRSEFKKLARSAVQRKDVLKTLGKPDKTEATETMEHWTYYGKTVDDLTGKTDYAAVLQWDLSGNVLDDIVFYAERKSAQHK